MEAVASRRRSGLYASWVALLQLSTRTTFSFSPELFSDEKTLIYPSQVVDLSRYHAITFCIRRTDSPKVLLVDIKEQSSDMVDATRAMRTWFKLTLEGLSDCPLYYLPAVGHRWTWVETLTGKDLPDDFASDAASVASFCNAKLMVLKARFMAD